MAFLKSENTKFLEKKITTTQIHNLDLTTVNLLVCSLLDFVYYFVYWLYIVKLIFMKQLYYTCFVCIHTYYVHSYIIYDFSLNNLLWISSHVNRYRSMPLFSIAS